MSSGVIRDFAGPYYVSVRLKSYFYIFRQNMESCVSNYMGSIGYCCYFQILVLLQE